MTTNTIPDLRNGINEKLFIDAVSAESLSIIHTDQDTFYEKVKNNEILSNEVYVVSSEFINAYDEQIKNVAEPTLSGDAATKNYADQISSSLNAGINDLA